MTIGDFSTIAGAIESILIGLAVLSGGIWALFRYTSLREAKKARAELDVLRKSLEERAFLESKVEASRLNAPGEFPAQLLVSVSLLNLGNHPEIIIWSEGKIFMRKIDIGKDGLTQYSTPLEVSLEKPWEPGLRTIIHGKQRIDFPNLVVPVSEAGTYHINLQIAISSREHAIQLAEGILPGESYVEVVRRMEPQGASIYYNAETIILIE